ncbi:MAG: sugar phosphate isomerase/epimerase [Terracidiphilus sp.]|jgi:inosose dehydratase
MSSSRREFLAGLAGAGALATLPRPVRASVAGPLYPPMNLSAFQTPIHHGETEIRLGCAAMTWGDNAANAINDISADGFAGIQLRAPTLDQYPDPHVLRDLLAQNKLTFVALSSGQTSIDPAVRAQQLETHVQHARYVQEAGGHYLQLISAGAKPGQTFTADQYKLQGEVFTEIGKHIADYGIKLGFHNHMNSIGQPPEAVDAILAASDPNYAYLLLDVAHYVQGGGDPVAAIHKYSKRILFMHFKDVKNADNPNGYEWVELGNGRVDLPGVIAALHEVHFRGWGVVELDRVPKGDALTPKEANAVSLQFLEKLGVRA